MENSDYKLQAKRLRKQLEAEGFQLTHSHALELIAKTYGFRDWNTLNANPHARVYQLGAQVHGLYLGHNFEGTIVSARKLGAYYEVTIQFSKDVQVCKLGDHSVIRKCVTARLDSTGKTMTKISNGQCHMVLH